MESRWLLYLAILAFCLPSVTLAHSYMTKPTSRIESENQSGCRGPSCRGPCDAPKSEMGDVHIANRGDEISVEWPRNNHPGGFVRYAWTTFDQSDSHQAFDQGVQAFSCYEIGPGCRSSSSFLNGGDDNPQDGSVNPCRLKLRIPLHLPNGMVTLQWAWFGGLSNPIVLGDYYACADYQITGGPTGPYKQPVFYGGDVSHPNEDVCKFSVTRQLRVCIDQPCLNGRYPNSGNEVGVPIPTSPNEVAWISAKSGQTTTEGGRKPDNPTPAPTPAPIPARRCGPNFNNAVCDGGQCCSGSGFCGAQFCVVPAPTSPSRNDGRCGPGWNNAGCKPGECCSRFSFCGTGPDFCGPPNPIFFLDDIWPIIKARGGIHVTVPDGWNRLRMPDPQTAYKNLINIASIGNPSKVYVKPGDPDNSYLIIKLTNGPGMSGQQMPLGGQYLSGDEIDKFRKWISQGAKFSSSIVPAPTPAPTPAPMPAPTPAPNPQPPNGNACFGKDNGLACEPGDCSCSFSICKGGVSAGILKVAPGTVCVANGIAPGSDPRCSIKC